MEWLIKEKKIIAIGTDAASLENFTLLHQPNHNLIFKNNLAMMESLTNLDKIKDERTLVFMLPLKIIGLEACPCRIIAIRDGGII